MDTVTILRDLWRCRLAVVGVLLLAVLTGAVVLYKVSFPLKVESRKYHVGVATNSILVDTPSSQVVELSAEGSDTLGLRANLLARLMVDGAVKTTIAKKAGLDPQELIGFSTSGQDLPVAKPEDRHAPILRTRVLANGDGAQLPIIQVETQAANVQEAAKLADAAVAGLSEYLDSKAASQAVPNARRLQVGPLGVTEAETTARGPRDLFGAAATLIVFGLGCALILSVLRLKRGWRAAILEERLPATSSGARSNGAGASSQDSAVPDAPAAGATGDTTRDRTRDDDTKSKPPSSVPARSSWFTPPSGTVTDVDKPESTLLVTDARRSELRLTPASRASRSV